MVVVRAEYRQCLLGRRNKAGHSIILTLGVARYGATVRKQEIRQRLAMSAKWAWIVQGSWRRLSESGLLTEPDRVIAARKRVERGVLDRGNIMASWKHQNRLSKDLNHGFEATTC